MFYPFQVHVPEYALQVVEECQAEGIDATKDEDKRSIEAL
jgi:hypothetical protein